MASAPSRPGGLTVICGPMFAGKTSSLLRAAAAAEQAGHPWVAFKPRRDTRYDAGSIVTHAGGTLNCTVIDDPRHILPAAHGVTAVLIDEAHFFGAPLVEPVLALIARGCLVTVAGLERDHRGEPFEPFPRLLCEADAVLKLSGPCARCGAPAVHSQRLIDSSDRIVVGGAEAYEPRCRACFVPGR
jgi:thymidine kinase